LRQTCAHKRSPFSREFGRETNPFRGIYTPATLRQRGFVTFCDTTQRKKRTQRPLVIWTSSFIGHSGIAHTRNGVPAPRLHSSPWMAHSALRDRPNRRQRPSCHQAS